MHIHMHISMRAGVTVIAGGEIHSMLLTQDKNKDSSLWATGYNREGEFGDGTSTKQLTYYEAKAASPFKKKFEKVKAVSSGQCCTKGMLTSVRV